VGVQRTLKSYDNKFLGRNLEQNMLENAQFFKKSWKIVIALGSPSPLLASLPPDPRILTPITCYGYFLKHVCSANMWIVEKEQMYQ